MSKQRATFSKRQRDQDKQAKAAAKRERRASRPDQDEDVPDSPAGGSYDQEGVLNALAGLHQAYDDGEVGLEDFEIRRDELRSRLRVD